MTRSRTIRVAAGVAVSLALAGCGSRLDHEAVVQAASGYGLAGTVSGTGTSGTGMPGTVPGTTVPLAGAPAGTLGGAPAGGTPVPGGPGQSGPAGTQPGVDSHPAQPGGSGNGGGASTAPAAGGGPIVIGSVGTYSGPVGIAWVQGARALQAWAAATNSAGGINGRMVQVIVMDDGNDAAKSRAQVQELVESRGAVAIVAAMTSPHTLAAWQGYVEQKRIPVIGGDCSTLPWTSSPMLFSECPSSPSQMDGLALLGARYGKGNKVGGLFCSESDACAYAEDRFFGSGRAAERFGLEPSYQAKISLTQPDFTAECIAARNNGVELLVVAADPSTVGRVAASCKRQNYSPQFLQPSATLAADSVTKPGLEEVLGSMPVFPFTGVNSSAAREFQAAWQQYGDGQAPGPAAVLGWASAKIFEQAARTAGGRIDSGGLLASLYSFRNERFGGLTVPLTYVDGRGTADSRCTFMMKGSGGQWTAPAGDRPMCW